GLLVEMQDGFGVAAGPVVVAGGRQFRPQFGMIVDFAVVDDPDAAVFVGHRLVSTLDVYNRQTPVCKPNGSPHDRSVPVRTAVNERVTHAHEPRLLGAFTWITFHDAGDAAHGSPRSTKTACSLTRTVSPERSKLKPTGTPSSSLIKLTAGGEAEPSASDTSNVRTRHGRATLAEY